jgi:hypothetical protein
MGGVQEVAAGVVKDPSKSDMAKGGVYVRGVFLIADREPIHDRGNGATRSSPQWSHAGAKKGAPSLLEPD